ncbi:HAD family hydrolase [Immundisolibacter sp.]|uniref:HAD family hydrolase n=1 Tax=Immundisolibacter sp. TaxID=1934948 RepID=UPI00356531A3
MPAPPILAITFDLDDTLWAIDPVIERAEQRMHAWLAEHYPRLPERYSPADLRELRDGLLQQRPELAHDLGTLRRESLALAAQHCGYGRDAAEGAFAVMWQARNEVELFADVLPVLTELAAQLTLGGLTNGNADIARIGLGGLLRFCVSAHSVGVAKPHPAIFEAASAAAGVPVEQVLHVGDDPQRDVIGARAAGMRTVWVNRDALAWPGGPRADAEVADLHGLRELLLRWHIVPGA